MIKETRFLAFCLTNQLKYTLMAQILIRSYKVDRSGLETRVLTSSRETHAALNSLLCSHGINFKDWEVKTSYACFLFALC